VHYVLTIRCSNLCAYTSKYLNRDGRYGHFSSKSANDSVLRVVGLVSKHNTACTMFMTVKRIHLGAYTSKYLNQEGNYYHFPSKSTNDRVLRVVGLVSKHTTVCTMS
jgi:hypothetical protein